MPEIDSIYVDEETYTLADIEARKINSLVVTPLEGEPILPQTGDTVNLGFSKVNKYIQNMEENFQDGVDKLANACIGKGSTPAKPYTPDTVADAIDAIQTGGSYGTLDISITPTGTTYNAEDYPGIDAQNIVRVVPPEAPFRVRFYSDDRQTLLKTEADVPQGGSASCTALDGTILNGLYFKGQNPMPTNVKDNLDCYPVRGDYQIDENEISDDWETICADCGAHYPLGSYKSIVIPIPAFAASSQTDFTWHCTDGTEWFPNGAIENSAFELSMHMVKVAEGEDGTTSTWLSTSVIPVYPVWRDGGVQYSSNVRSFAAGAVCYAGSGYVDGLSFDQGTSPQRWYMNGWFFDHLYSVLKDNIKAVNKQFAAFARSPLFTGYSVGWERGDTKVYKTSFDKIWTPSVKELHTLFAAQSSFSDYSGCEEPNGIDYSLVYTPSYSGRFLTRTEYVGPNYVNPLSIYGGQVTTITAGTPGMPFGFCL